MKFNYQIFAAVLFPLAYGCVPPPGSDLGPVGLQVTPANNPTTPSAGATPTPTPTPTSTPTPIPTPSPTQIALLSYGGLTYPSGAPFPYPQFATVVGMTTTIAPTHAGYAITNCTITPALPTGLSFSASDCSISGTPTIASTPVLYLVTVYNGPNTNTAILALGVSPSGTQMFATQQTNYLMSAGQSTSIPIEVGGGASASNCSNGSSAPAGMTSSSCTVSGTPTNAGTDGVGYFTSGSIPIFAGYEVIPYYYHFAAGEWRDTGFPSSESFASFIISSAGSEPVVSYGGQQPFTQENLVAGTPIEPITPTNTGAAIVSCAASPSLPAGLSVSQTDCSVTGTPTTPSSASVYTLTPASNSNSGNSLTLTLSVSPATVKEMSCQSGTLCVHDLMPLWDQSDAALTTYVNSQTGYSLPSDPGWCGAVSGAMVLSSYLQEVQTYTGLQPTAIPSPYSAGMTEYPFIYQTMGLLGTDIQAGGTPTPPNNGMATFLGQCMQTDDLYDVSWAFPYLTLPWESVPSFRQGIPLGWLAICQFGDIGNCHALAVNGTEGSYFKIYDPWGTVYDATINVSFPAPSGNAGDHGTISFESGNSDNFNSVESSGTAMIFGADWIFGYVYTQNGPTPFTKCAEPAQ